MGSVKTYSKKIISHPFFSGSMVMIIGSNIANIFAYLYHIVFGRLLTEVEYGNLSAFLALLGLLGTAIGFLGLIIVKFISSSNEEEVSEIIHWFTKKTLVITGSISILLAFASPILATSLKMPFYLVLLVAPTFFLMSVLFLLTAYLQGLMKFFTLAFITNINLLTRILVGVFLVYLGFSTMGPSLGILIGMLLGIIVSYFAIKKYILPVSKNKLVLGKKEFYLAMPMFITSVGTTAIMNIDILLFKYYFPPELAGKYAATTILGKIIFYATSPISTVMFPIISNNFSRGGKYQIVFILSFILSLLAGTGVTMIYFLFPRLAILPLYGERYLDIAPYIGMYGIFITLFSLSSLIVNYFQSIDKPKIGLIFLVAVFVEVFAIVLFHDSVKIFIQNLIVVMSATFAALVIYFYYETQKE